MINPYNWKREHQVALLFSMLVGAAAGILIGFAIASFKVPWPFAKWLLENRTSDAVGFAILGAIIAGGIVYARRLFSN